MNDSALDNFPSIIIPCEDLHALKILLLKLFKNKIVCDDDYILKNVPDNFLEILQDPDYFKTTSIKGIKIPKRNLELIERNTEDLL